MLRTARLLNLRRTRRQPLRALITLVSVASGVAMSVAVVILIGSINTSLHRFDARLGGPASLRVVGATTRGGLDASVLAKVEQTPGVAAAVPVVQAVTYAQAANGRNVPVVALGIDCRVERVLGPIGCDPALLAKFTTKSPPLAPPSLLKRMGPGAVLRTDLGDNPLAGGPTVPQLDQVNHGNVVVVPLPVAQQLFNREGRLDAVYVKEAPGTSVAALRARLADVVGPWNGVLRAGDPPVGAGALASAFVPIFMLMASFALGVGAVLIFNTMSLSLEDRRKDLAVIGAVGAPPTTLFIGTLVEAAVLGLLGGGLGVLGGFLVAHPLAASMTDFTSKVAGVSIAVSVSPAAAVIGVLLGVVVAAGAAFVPARRAIRMDVAAELSNREARSAASPRAGVRRTALFALVGGLGLVLCWVAQRGGALEPWQAALGPVGVCVASIGILFTTGSLARLATLGARRADRGRSGSTLRMALANTVREPGRTAVMAVAVAASVVTAFVVASSRASIHDAISRGFLTGNTHEVFITTQQSTNSFNLEGRPSPELVAKLAAVPGVAKIDRTATALTGHDDKHLIGVVAFEYPWLNWDVAAGTVDRARFEAGEVLIGPGLARSEHLRPGSMVKLPTPTGVVSLKVQGVVYDGNFTGRVVDMPMPLFRRLYGDQPSQGVGLIADSRTSPDQLAARVRALGLGRNVIVRTPRQMVEQASREVGQQLAPFKAMQRVLLFVAFIAVLSTLLLVGAQRRRELGMLAAIGMEPGQLARMTVAEAALVGLVGVALSVIGAVAMEVSFNLIVPIVIGFKDPLRFAFSSMLTAGPLAAVVVVAAAALPALRTAKVEVLEALRYE